MDVYLFHDGKSGFSVRLPTAENGNSLGLAQNNCANMFIGVAHPCGSARGKHGVQTADIWKGFDQKRPFALYTVSELIKPRML